ncbi:MAG: hypothetical protein LLG01_01695 [Planctomycetaceae bacterium]|nr:hypothetical protein [Planctomycetaceae bacterium]
MRPKAREKLMRKWLTVDRIDYCDHIEELAALKLTPSERQELGQWLLVGPEKELVQAWTGLMGRSPDRTYLPVLVKCFDTDNAVMAECVVRALIQGDYPGALEIIFACDRGLKAAGDELPWELSNRMHELTPAMQRKFAQLFCQRFVNFPEYFETADGNRHPPCLLCQDDAWLHALAAIEYTDENVEKTLLWVWDNLVHRTQDEYIVLTAMAAHPRPSYKKIFNAYSRNRTIDLRELAQAGLEGLESQGK